MQWGPKFNYGHWDENLKVFPARKYVIESIQFWVEKFHIDGIRFDATRAIANFDALRELASRHGFDKIDKRKPFLTVAEHRRARGSGHHRGFFRTVRWCAAWRRSRWARTTARCWNGAGERRSESPDDLDGFLTALDPAKKLATVVGAAVGA